MALSTTAQFQALKTEALKPAYAAQRAANDYQGIADALNAPNAAITVPRLAVSQLDLLNAIDNRDLSTSNNTVAGAYAGALFGLGRVPLVEADGVTKNRIRQNLDRAIANTNGSQTRFDAIVNKSPASRAEQMFGETTVLTDNDVARALTEF